MKNYYKLITQRLFSIYIIYTLLFSIVAYSTTLMYNRHDYIRKEAKRAEQIITTLDNHLSTSISTVSALSKYEYILKYSQLTQPDPIIVSKAYTELSPQVALNTDYMNIAILNFPNKHVIKNNGAMSYDFFKKYYGLENTDIDRLAESLYNGENKNKSLLFTSSAGEKSYIVCLTSCSTEDKYFDKPVICVLLYDINSLFGRINESTIPSAYELYMSKGDIRISVDESKSNSVQFSTVGFDHKGKRIAHMNYYSNYWGDFSASIYVPYIQYLMHINSFFLIILLIMVAFAFVSYFFIKTSADKLYSPIKKLMRILPSELSSVSSGGDLSVFENYITTLENRQNVMSDIISKTKIELNDKFLIQLMSNTLSKMEIHDGLITYELNTVKFPLICFIITYKNYQDLKNILSIDGLNEVRSSIHEIINENFKNKSFFRLLDIDSQTIAAISSVSDKKKTLAELRRAALNIEMMLDINLVMFTGSLAESWYDIPDSYLEALQLKNSSLITSDKGIVFTSEKSENRHINYPSEIEDILIESVISANANTAIETMHKIVDLNMSCEMLTHEQFSHFAVMLYSTVIKLLTAINKTEKELFGDVKIYLELISCQNSEELKQRLAYFLTTVMQSITNTRKSIAGGITERMYSYIDENYEKDISLFSLADHLNLSQSYVSKIFKQNTGENFKDYLANVRMLKAVELIRAEPYRKISDIAKAVGYSNSNFTRVFAKKYGKSPNDYAKELQN